ncbi:phenylpropionate dioxygenase-like ring-hydroxylating dioxygenase large terminal subunit [Variovorax sp. 54]|uniref:Rieske 2Fe-2S domain-containing protein n=1 Tax=Variovorax sp. 54 TaxID=2035212 RepID=UPI000C492C86|nr:Rieske 2Fe-2S domain-containing protein [Variovorax sp. 54]PIF75321.1 phenylpropionate dioxygenase-like ring-hydroxylating dioxygenase large terminal subunit [Variovorax sp. 54]
MNKPLTPFTIDTLFQAGGGSAPDIPVQCAAQARTGPQQFRSTVGEERRVLPYAEGWFLGCFADELKPGQIRTIPFMGQELVLYRTLAGLVRVVEPHCPHLGAHLGHGGKVDGEHLVCPLHGLAYGPDGGCVRTGAGDRPPRAALTARHAREVNGAILVWVNHAGLPPTWEVPVHDFGIGSPTLYIRQEMDGQAHDAVENSADVAHFSWVHGLTDTHMSYRIDGNLFEVSLSARWKGKRFCGTFLNYGVGCAAGLFDMPDLGVRLNSIAYFVQTAPLKWRMDVANQLSIARVNRWPPMLRNLVYRLLASPANFWLTWFVKPDYAIWNAKHFVPHPKLTASDKTVISHRRWASRFYPGGLVDGLDPAGLQEHRHES